jgi:hypothetical protein
MTPKNSKKGATQSAEALAPCSDTFKRGDIVSRPLSEDTLETGTVLRRIAYKPGDSCEEAYAVQGMGGSVPAHVLTLVTPAPEATPAQS